MRELFKGWRRKAGCVTLVMACVITSLWMRSYYLCDDVWFQIGSRTHMITSLRGGIGWSSWDYVMADSGLITRDLSREPNLVGIPFRDYMKRWDNQRRYASWNVWYWYAYYWQCCVPLTLLSAYLILWKPRWAK